MTDPLVRPAARNPLRRTRLPLLPPGARSRPAQLYTRCAAEGRFALQRCAGCGAFTYPAHDACPVCLSADLPLTEAPCDGILVTETTIHVPADVYFRERAPWRIGLVKLGCGPHGGWRICMPTAGRTSRCGCRSGSTAAAMRSRWHSPPVTRPSLPMTGNSER